MSQTINRIKLYKDKIRIATTRVGGGVRNNNMPFNESNFKIHKGVTNNIEFSVRNNDRKPIDLTNNRLIATIINPYTGEHYLQKTLEPVNQERGIANLVLSPGDVIDWEEGYYNYSIIIENADSTQNLLFLDQNQKAIGMFDLRGEALPSIIQSVELDPSKFTPNGHNFPIPNVTENQYISSAVAGSSQLDLKNGLHTFTIIANNFSGKFLVEGSLEDEPSTNIVHPNTDWFPIQVEAGPEDGVLTFNKFTGIEAFNFFSNVSWIRFTYSPDRLNEGELQKIQIIS